MKILIVEDEKRLSAILKKGLEEHSFAVDVAFDGEEGLYRAENYITKPFDFSELLARLRSVIRRSKAKPSPVITIDELAIDSNARTVMRAGRPIQLSSTEYNLLEYLAMNHGRVVSRAELIDHLYDSEFERDSNIIDVYMNYLRNKVDKGFQRQLLHTVRGAGYMLKDG